MCEVAWSDKPWWWLYKSETEALRLRTLEQEKLMKDFHFIEFVDFTEPGAPECP